MIKTDTRLTAIEVIEVAGPGPDVRQAFTPAGSLTSRYIRVRSADGAEGLYGPIDQETVGPILRQLGPLICGQDANAINDVWQKMASTRHSHVGHLRMALSAIDNALWDLKGVRAAMPVWRLLGGGTRSVIPLYASTLGSSLEPAEAAATALELVGSGWSAQKWFPKAGPSEAEDGLRRNTALARALRDALEDDRDLMFDAGGRWTLAYATAWERRVRDTLPTWIEEPFKADQFDAYLHFARQSSVPLAAGEHLYGMGEVLPYLRDGVVGVMQSDPEWCGGVTELVRICAVASAYGIQVMPHGHGLHAATHIVASQSPLVCPRGEYLINVMVDRHHFEIDPPTPQNGRITMTELPGFGIRLDDSKIERRVTLSAT